MLFFVFSFCFFLFLSVLFFSFLFRSVPFCSVPFRFFSFCLVLFFLFSFILFCFVSFFLYDVASIHAVASINNIAVMVFLQGDSGGPLTVEGANGAHTLVGIVSRKLDFVCGELGYDVYTSVSAFLPWIESTIKENGGMASCGFDISAPPTLGQLHNFYPKHNSRKEL